MNMTELTNDEMTAVEGGHWFRWLLAGVAYLISGPRAYGNTSSGPELMYDGGELDLPNAQLVSRNGISLV